nr:MAG TPA: hypothetical protein [Caudoviricetes sp.]DAU44193.1 MAG TPA: hypothetical protein [Caudoviricetes sp.]
MSKLKFIIPVIMFIRINDIQHAIKFLFNFLSNIFSLSFL